jgi:hypothetical protein
MGVMDGVMLLCAWQFQDNPKSALRLTSLLASLFLPEI